MSRKGPQRKAMLPGDPVFNSVLVQRFVNKMMYDGKKSVSEGIFYSAMTRIEEKSGQNPLEVFARAFKLDLRLLACGMSALLCGGLACCRCLSDGVMGLVPHAASSAQVKYRDV